MCVYYKESFVARNISISQNVGDSMCGTRALCMTGRRQPQQASAFPASVSAEGSNCTTMPFISNSRVAATRFKIPGERAKSRPGLDPSLRLAQLPRRMPAQRRIQGHPRLHPAPKPRPHRLTDRPTFSPGVRAQFGNALRNRDQVSTGGRADAVMLTRMLKRQKDHVSSTFP